MPASDDALTELARLGFADLGERRRSPSLPSGCRIGLVPPASRAAPTPTRRCGCSSQLRESAPRRRVTRCSPSEASAERLLRVLGASRGSPTSCCATRSSSAALETRSIGAARDAAQYRADLRRPAVAGSRGRGGAGTPSGSRYRRRARPLAAWDLEQRRPVDGRRQRSPRRSPTWPAPRSTPRSRVARGGAVAPFPGGRGRAPPGSRSSAWARRARASSTT